MEDKFQKSVDALLATFTTPEQCDRFKDVVLAMQEMLADKETN